MWPKGCAHWGLAADLHNGLDTWDPKTPTQMSQSPLPEPGGPLPWVCASEGVRTVG